MNPPGCLPRYTCGQTFFYPAFSAARQEDALKFAHEFGWILASPIGLEGLTRIRLSKGMFRPILSPSAAVLFPSLKFENKNG